MKIVSKYKEYYDYLQGVYGIDDKLVLDRTSYYKLPYPLSNGKSTIHIGETVVEVYWREDVPYIGEEIKKYSIVNKNAFGIYPSLHGMYNNTSHKDYYFIPNGKYSFIRVLKQPLDLKDKSPTWKEDCPILLETHQGFKKFPLLKEYNVSKKLSAEAIWMLLTQWLSKQIDKKEKVPEMSDKSKILAAGFDLKTSFKKEKS